MKLRQKTWQGQSPSSAHQELRLKVEVFGGNRFEDKSLNKSRVHSLPLEKKGVKAEEKEEEEVRRRRGRRRR